MDRPEVQWSIRYLKNFGSLNRVGTVGSSRVSFIMSNGFRYMI